MICELSIEETRELLGAEADGMTDEQVMALRDEGHEVALLIVGAYREHRKSEALIAAGLRPRRRSQEG